MATVPFHYVDLRTFCYATEDEKRVEDALRTFLPADFEVERATSDGYHGDRIVVLSARVENADGIRHVLSRLAALPDVDDVLDELDDRVDDNCAFYLTLDKQAAFRGTVRRGDGVTFRAKVEAYPAERETAVENARETLSDLRDEDGEGETAGETADEDRSESETETETETGAGSRDDGGSGGADGDGEGASAPD